MIDKNSLYWLWRASYGVRDRIFLIVLVGGMRVLTGLGIVYASKRMIDVATGYLEGSLFYYCLWLCIMSLGSIVLNAFVNHKTLLLEIELQNLLCGNIYRDLLYAREWDDDVMHSGDIQSRLGGDLRSVIILLTSSFPSMLVNGIQLLTVFLFFDRMDATLARVFFPGVIVVLFFARLYGKRMRMLTSGIRSSEASIQSFTQESIQHRNIIKTLERELYMQDRLKSLQSDLYRKVKERTLYSVSSRGLISMGFAGIYIIALSWGTMQLRAGLISFGVITAYIQLTGLIQRPILDLVRLYPSFVMTLASVDRLREVESKECVTYVPTDQLEAKVGLRMTDVTFSYGDRCILKNFSHDFRPGSITVVSAPTGAGKTTLMRLILALISPQEGEIELYDSQRIVPVSSKMRRYYIYVPQGNTLLSGTIRENLLLGDPEATEEQMLTVLEIAVATFVFDLPLGLDTYCGEHGVGLSEGQAQRIVIARSLLHRGHILLLDEATSALDPETEALFIERLMLYGVHKTIIFITHRNNPIEGCELLQL